MNIVTTPAKPFKVLIAVNADALRKSLGDYVTAHFSNVTVYSAKDGSETIGKLESDPPAVMILDDQITRRSHQQIIKSVYDNARTRDIQTLLLHHQPLRPGLEDNVAQGVLHVVPMPDKTNAFPSAIYNAVNRLGRGGENFKLRYLRKGEILLRQGEQGDRLFILHKGKLSAFVDSESDPTQKVTLGYIAPGEFVGEMSLFNNEPRMASVVAEEDSELVEMRGETFAQVLYRKPSWMKAMLHTLSRRLKISNINRQKRESKR